MITHQDHPPIDNQDHINWHEPANRHAQERLTLRRLLLLVPFLWLSIAVIAVFIAVF